MRAFCSSLLYWCQKSFWVIISTPPPPPFIDFIVNIDTAQITRIMKNCLMLQLIQN